MTPSQRQQLFQHQEDGARWLAARHRCGLHDDMGLGKTATAVTALDLLGARRGIVVCNASIKENWRRELLRWSPVPRRIRKARDITDLNDFLKYYYDVMLVSHEMLTRWHKGLMPRLSILDFMIIDEAHKTKNPESQRTIALKGKQSDGIGGVTQFARYTWELTGTPIPNDPIDLYPFLKFCGALGSMPRHQFAREYFISTAGRYSSRQAIRPGKQAALQELVRGFSLRRTGGVDIPPIWLTQTFLDGDARKVAAFMREHPGLDRAILRALDSGNLNLIESAQIMTLRRLIGEAKAIPFAHYLIDLMKGGLKSPLVFAWHKNVLDIVQTLLENKGFRIGRIDGSVADHKRQPVVDAFQLGQLDGLVCNMQAGGEGLTMTRCKHAFMLEMGFAPYHNSQPIKRIHRIGQDQKTRAEFITLTGSYDEEIVGIVRAKVQAIFDIDGQQVLAAPAA